MQDVLLEFVGDIYEASYKPAHWEVVMERLCQLTQAKSAVLAIEDQHSGNRQIISMHGISRLLTVAYNAGLGKYDNTFSFVKTRIHQPTLIATEDLKRNNPSYFQFIMKPANIGHISVVDLHHDSAIRIGLAVHRSFDAPPFSDQEAWLMQRVAPHFSRSVLIQHELKSARRESWEMMQLVSKIPMGLMLIDSSANIRFHNAVADFLLSSHAALSIDHNRLRAFNHEEQKQLEDALQYIFQPPDPSPDNTTRKRTISLSHPDHTFPLVLFVTSTSQTDASLIPQADKNLATIYLSDPGASINVSAAQLSDVFSLTPAEAQVALCLVNGLKLSEIAIHKGTTLETVRSQLKNIFAKLGVNTQQDVIRVIVRAMLPLSE